MSYFGRCEGTFTTPFTALAPIGITRPTATTSIMSGTVWDTVIQGRTYSSQTVLSTGTLFAEPVTVLWQSSDLSRFPGAFATSLAAKMEVSYGEQQPSLTTGAKAGIAVGAVFGFALLVGALIVLYRRKRKETRQAGLPEDMAEMPGNSPGLKKMFRGKWRAEMDGESQAVELDSKKVHVAPGPPAELEALPHGRNTDPTMR